MDAEKAKELFEYDPETGILRWRINLSSHLKGSIAGTLKTKRDKQYLIIRYDGKEYLAHRLAFLLMMGRWPDPQVDHKNGVKYDNRWSNLREATIAQNAQNRVTSRSLNEVGFKGVVRVERYGVTKYEARIKANGKQKHLGRFDSAQEAHQAYVTGVEELHGDFARLETKR